jgi:hypothetical protein
MPRAPKRCGRDGCDLRMPCPKHRQKRPGGRYSSSHSKERAAWVPAVATGKVQCRRGEKCRRYPDTLIDPSKPWHLGHPDQECPAPTAPEHARCNTGAAGAQQNL